jgi:phosphatidate cytidylyltransferase
MTDDSAASAKKSDLGVRTLSAIVMVTVAGTALWLGGWPFAGFVVAVGLGVLWEWWGLARKIAKTPAALVVWMLGGLAYVGIAVAMLIVLRQNNLLAAAMPILLVIAVDVGAYFAGRTFGGPKIAPSISPSKTWAGLAGGAVGAALVMIGRGYFDMWRAQQQLDSWHMGGLAPERPLLEWLLLIAAGVLVAIIAQSGDFFESWMKRRAGVKDSGRLIPGHGGLFDRVDGLLALCFVMGLTVIALIAYTLAMGGEMLPTPA